MAELVFPGGVMLDRSVVQSQTIEEPDARMAPAEPT
jgi:hypothetical protein